MGWLRRKSRPAEVADLISPKQGNYNCWRILWQGRIAELALISSGRDIVIVVRGAHILGEIEICRIAKPEGENPWSEAEFDHDGHRVHVISEWRPDPPVSSLVFIDGVSLKDGRTLEAWQRDRPRPKDRYEQMYERMTYLRGAGAVIFASWFVFGLARRAPALLTHSPFVWIGTPVLLCAALLATGRFADWLLARRNISALVRTLLLAYAFVGVWMAAMWVSTVLVLNF